MAPRPPQTQIPQTTIFYDVETSLEGTFTFLNRFLVDVFFCFWLVLWLVCCLVYAFSYAHHDFFCTDAIKKNVTPTVEGMMAGLARKAVG